MKSIKNLFENNRKWSEDINKKNPDFFPTLSKQQAPKYLWIGCADSRVPANEVVGLLPGELFVHRNVANVVIHTDLNCLSVMQYAIEVLKVEHVIVCGHYGCGGVIAALNVNRYGLIDNWLRHVKDVRERHGHHISLLKDQKQKEDCMCELNAIEQAINVCQTTIVQDAWLRGQNLTVHACIYGLKDGILKDLGMSISSLGEMNSNYLNALALEGIGVKDFTRLPNIVH
ncbi:MAG: carbonate dehydratase [Planctomycetota bacterium]